MKVSTAPCCASSPGGSPTRGSTGPRPVRLTVEAGEPWDAVVAHAAANGWSGIEALSGIPGSAGAAPVQNIGAYGQELSSSLVAIDFLDFDTGKLVRVPAAELGLGYRTSALKRGRLGLVVSLELALADDSGVEPTDRLRPTRRRPRGAHRRSRAGGRTAGRRTRTARQQGDAVGPRRPRLGERRLVLHEPRGERAVRPATTRRRAALADSSRGGRARAAPRIRHPARRARRVPREAECRVAHREGRSSSGGFRSRGRGPRSRRSTPSRS